MERTKAARNDLKGPTDDQQMIYRWSMSYRRLTDDLQKVYRWLMDDLQVTNWRCKDDRCTDDRWLNYRLRMTDVELQMIYKRSRNDLQMSYGWFTDGVQMTSRWFIDEKWKTEMKIENKGTRRECDGIKDHCYAIRLTYTVSFQSQPCHRKECWKIK